jgi:hypothetical protein
MPALLPRSVDCRACRAGNCHLTRIHKVGDSGGLLQNFSLPPRHQTEYRSGGGILLFKVNNSRQILSSKLMPYSLDLRIRVVESIDPTGEFDRISLLGCYQLDLSCRTRSNDNSVILAIEIVPSNKTEHKTYPATKE